MVIKTIADVDKFWKAIDSCDGGVVLRSADDKEVLNLKSILSRYVAVADLIKEHGDSYEFFCERKTDEPKLYQLFV